MSWEQIVGQCQVEGELEPLILDFDNINSAASQCGLGRFPQSYISYFKAFGHGVWFNELEVLPPVRVTPDTFSINDYLEQQWPEAAAVDPDDDSLPIEHLVPVILSGIDDVYLCWDRRDDAVLNDERPIYLVDIINYICVKCADSFGEVFARLLIKGELADFLGNVVEGWEWQSEFTPFGEL